MKLNENNQVPDTLMAKKRDFVRGIDFDMHNDRGIIDSIKIKDASVTTAKIGSAAITDANIGSLSFSVLSGGTATLGGTANGDGLLIVNNAGGTEVVRLDNTGVTITAGTITGVNFATTTIQSGTILNAFIGTSTYQGGTIANALIGTSQITGGSAAAMTIGTPAITGGTYTTPRLAGTTVLDTNAGSATLALSGQFAIQTHTGSAILVARLGATTYFFTAAGTLA